MRKQQLRASIAFWKTLALLVIFGGIFLSYFWYVMHTNPKGLLGARTFFDYYTLLLQAFLHGRLDVATPTGSYDLSFFKGKWYPYWGPSAVLFISPLYAVLRDKATDVLYTFIAGIGNVFLFWFLLKEFFLYFKKKDAFSAKIVLLLSFAFASPNFYLSLSGRIWHTEEIISLFYILISLIFFFRYLNTKEKKIRYFVISVVFFNLAWLTRLPLILYGSVFLYLLFVLRHDRKKLLLSCSLFLIISSLFLDFFFVYNFVRFGNAVETGLLYHNGNPRYYETLRKSTLFSLEFVPYNALHMFGNNLSFSAVKPYVAIDLEGNSIFSVYPMLLLIFFVFRKKILAQKQVLAFVIVAVIPIVLYIALLLLLMATGWTQFGYRYILSIIPLFFLLIAFVLEDIPLLVTWLLLIYSIAITLLGTLAFYPT